jgi:putative ABC transport system permease protein
VLALARLLLALGSAIVPLAFRDDWTREWRAELWHRREQLTAGGTLAFAARIDLLLRSCGAVIHAAWLRKEEWSLSVIVQDVRYALRELRDRPAFTSIAVLMLALGIGANTAVFSVLYGILLKRLPYRDPDRLVQIWETNPGRNWTHATVAPGNLVDWRARSRSFDSFAYYIGSDTKAPGVYDSTLTGYGEPERVRGMTVSGSFFSVLGAVPGIGRVPADDNELRGRPRVVVLSNGFWRRRFGSDPSILSRRVELNGSSYEVAGVMAAGFTIPGAAIDFWAPRTFDEAQFRDLRRPHYLRVIARLAPGVSIAQAREEMSRIARDLEREYPDTNADMGVGVGPLHEWLVGDSRRALVALMSSVGLVLLIACANVASLLLARATTRRRELAIRVALGAGRLRLLRQLLTESLVLASAGAAAGVLVARLAVAWVLAAGPADLPRLDQAAIDVRVLSFAALVSMATALVFGLAPAWHSVRMAPGESLQEGSRGPTAAGARMRRVLIAGEVALSVVLLVGAGLLLRSFAQLRATDPGIDVAEGVSFKISLPSQRYADGEKVSAFYTEAVRRIRSIPGVRAAGATARLALEGYTWTGDLFIDGRPEVWGRELRHKAITPGFFAAAGIPILQGRDFNSADTSRSQPVVIVNRTLARQYFNGVNPVGQRLTFGRPSPTTVWATIVAVVADEKQDGLATEIKPEVYDPQTQGARETMSFVVRTFGNPLGMLPAVRREIAALDARLAIYDVRTLEQVVERSIASERFATTVLTGFAGAALLLAAIGLYGVVAFAVSARTREIGLRLALGASRRSVLRMVVWDGLSVVLAGLAAGLLAAAALSGVIQAFLFDTRAADPVVLLSATGILTAAGVIASYVPALRAAHVDPAVSLRSE